MIEVAELTKRYPGVVAVRDASFAIDRGEIVGFLGPNGAGKTTTMRILTGYLAPSSGSARVAGFDVTRRSKEVRRRLGYLPESNPLYTEMRVRDYLRFRATLKEVPRRERTARVQEAIAACGLKSEAHRIIGHLSKGYRQRVGLADAIVHKPDVVILDEPTIGLDPNQVRQVRELIKQLGKERTVILSTHILSEVEIMCRRVIVIHRGRIRADGLHADLVNQFQIKRNIRLEVQSTQGREVKSVLEHLPGVQRVHWSDQGRTHRYVVEPHNHSDIRPSLHRVACEKSWEVVELAHDASALEDLFVHLTREADA